MRNYYDLNVKNQYFMNSYLTFKDKILFDISRRSVQLKDFQDFHKVLDERYFVLDSKSNNKLQITVHYDESIKKDGYILDINKGYIRVTASNERGAYYAFDLINELVIHKGSELQLPIIVIEDEPSFEFRGIIEGFYDTPWTHEERYDVFPFMKKNRLNTFMYAPKDDPYHRLLWADLYPESDIKHFKKLLERADKYQVDFWYTISPGYSKDGYPPFEYADEKDFERLFRKIDQLIEIGVRNFGLLLDDIDYQLNPTNKAKFQRPGIAHAYICNRFYEYVNSKIYKPNVIMCPTEYHQVGGSIYRTDLKNELNENIKVFYTGDNICAEVLTTRDIKETKEAFDKELFIWDNFPVSDFTKRTREYLAPIENRTVDLNKYATGYIINPSLHYYISKVGMHTMADYAWNTNKYHPGRAFENALNDVSPHFQKLSKAFIEFNYPSVLNHGNLAYEKEMVEKLDKEAIINYYKPVLESANNLLKLDLPIIEELDPWLRRVEKEFNLVKQILDDKATKKDVENLLEDIHSPGSELLDYLVFKKEIMSPETYYELTLKHRGSNWYRVFENDRWQRN